MVKKARQGTPNHLLRAARKERGWTQRDVADHIGAPLSLNVTRWEGGTSFPSAHYVEKLCILFGKSASELGLLQDESNGLSESEDDGVDEAVSDEIPSFPAAPPKGRGLAPRVVVSLFGAVLLVIIGGTGLLYIGYMNLSAAQRMASATSALSASDAEATAHVAVTATLVATYPDPYAPRTGKLAFYDPLSQPYLWKNETNSSFGSACQFIQGSYHVSETKTGNGGTCFNPDFDGSNFTFEVQMVIAQGDCGGIILRSVEPKDYQFAVCQDGTYQFTIYEDYTRFRTLVNKASSAIAIGLNQTNVIAVVANGSTIDLYVNGQKVESIQDSSYGHGQVGLIANNDQSSATEVIYSRAKLWTL